MDLTIVGILISLIVLVYSAILHEIAHGWVADRLGDPTARLMGRLTLNPIPHIDLYMTIILPVMLYFLTNGQLLLGGAKPVPVDEFNLKDGRKDMALVSLAGPATNVLLAILASLGVRLLFLIGVEEITANFFLTLVLHILTSIVQINILLAIFNLLPIPPLDGSKVFSLLLPERDARTFLSIGQFGIVLLIILLNFPIGPFSLGGLMFNILQFTENILLPHI